MGKGDNRREEDRRHSAGYRSEYDRIFRQPETACAGCDGCRRGLPVVDGFHEGHTSELEVFRCTALAPSV